MRQITLASQVGFEKYGRKSKRELFLETMGNIVPWGGLEAMIEPHYPKVGNGRHPVGLSVMLRVYFLQQWFNLSDPGVEEALYESPALRLRRTRRPSFVSAIFLNNTICAARFWTR